MQNKNVKTVYILILLLFSVEYLGWGELSVFRLGIFPLSLLGCIMMWSKTTFKQASSYSFFLILLLLWFSICQYITDNNPLFPIMMMPLAWFVIHFLFLKERPVIDYPLIFSFYTLPHIIAFVLGSYNLDGGRFAGLHEDPNFCGIFISVGIVGAVSCLVTKKLFVWLKVYFVCVITLSLALLFWTGSRGAMLSFGAIVVFFFFKNEKISIWYKILSIPVILISYHYLIVYINSLPAWVSADESIIDSVLCRFQSDSMAEGSHRSALWNQAYNKLIRSDFFTPIGSVKALQGTNYLFVHNTFIDFMLELGFVEGLLLDLFIFYHVIKGFSLFGRKKISVNDVTLLLIAIIVLAELFFLSAYTQKIAWLFVIAIICCTHKNYYKGVSNINS